MWERFYELCKRNKITPYMFGKENGIKGSTISTWKKRNTIGRESAIVIANYFGVSLDYILTGVGTSESENSMYYTDKKTREIAMAIYDNEKLIGLFDAVKDARDEDLQIVYDVLLKLKTIEKIKKEGDD